MWLPVSIGPTAGQRAPPVRRCTWGDCRVAGVGWACVICQSTESILQSCIWQRVRGWGNMPQQMVNARNGSHGNSRALVFPGAIPLSLFLLRDHQEVRSF